ncbi:MAG: DUF4262 domain-containing protein [Rubrivivax sp.]|nr:DUF4262 domain-containing protein [Pyrinomonadaceae bacterium]
MHVSSLALLKMCLTTIDPNLIGDEVKSGKVFEAGKDYSDIIEGHECRFEAVDEKWYSAFLGYAQWFYHDNNFPVLQCIWPDKNQQYPWDADFDKSLRGFQPLLISVSRSVELKVL